MVILALSGAFALLAAGAPAGAQPVILPPGAPTDVLATPSDASAIVSWTAPVDEGGEAVGGYAVTSTPAGGSETTDGATTTVTVDGLTNSVPYTFTVVASNSMGDGPPSEPSNAATPTPHIVVEPLGTDPTPSDLVQQLVGEGVVTENATYTGNDASSGRFSSGNVIGFADGILLTSGDATTVIGPNLGNTTGAPNGAGDDDLNALVGGTTYDAAVLEFDFTPTESPVYFNYVFSSEEYNEYVNSSFNDVFAFFVNGENCALVPGSSNPVAVNTINGGNPFGSDADNPDLYRNNDPDDPAPATLNTGMDGLTDVLTCQADVTPDASHHMKLAIADTSDENLDSAVFLKSGSFSTEPPGADLNLEQTDAPDPVNGGNQVLYALSVRNNGPAIAPNTTITDTLDPSVDLRSATVTSGGGGEGAALAPVGVCEQTEGGQIECNVGDLENGELGTVEIRVKTQEVEASTLITNTATASSDATDPNEDDNTSSEDTTVEPNSPDSDTGFIPPRGGSLTTDPGTGATPDDSTVLTMKFPAGPGGPASMQEEDGCEELPDGSFAPCIGKIGNFEPPPGYDRIVLKFVYDRTIVSGGLRDNRRPWKVFYLKPPDTTPIELPRCNANGDVPPCVMSTFRLDPSRDLQVKVAINSDPRLATRR